MLRKGFLNCSNLDKRQLPQEDDCSSPTSVRKFSQAEKGKSIAAFAPRHFGVRTSNHSLDWNSRSQDSWEDLADGLDPLDAKLINSALGKTS